MKFTKESVLKTFNSLTMPAWIKTESAFNAQFAKVIDMTVTQ